MSIQCSTGTTGQGTRLGHTYTGHYERARPYHTHVQQGGHAIRSRLACLVLAVLLVSAWSAVAQERRFYIYRDADSRDNNGVWSNWMPAEAAKMLKLNLADRTDPASGSTAVRVDVTFQRPEWCGIAVASCPNCWGEKSGEPAYDLRGAKKLVFSARGANSGETLQVKVAIAGDKPYGDSTRLPVASRWITLTKTWQSHEISVEGYDLTRVITPFAFVTNQQHNQEPKMTFYLDDIYFVMGDGQ